MRRARVLKALLVAALLALVAHLALHPPHLCSGEGAAAQDECVLCHVAQAALEAAPIAAPVPAARVLAVRPAERPRPVALARVLLVSPKQGPPRGA